MAYWFGWPKTIDCSDPEHPAFTASELGLEPLYNSLRICLRGVDTRTLAVLVSSAWIGSYLNVVDVTDPLHMSLVGSVGSSYFMGAKGLQIKP